MYYDTIEEAIAAAPHCTHVLTTASRWGYDHDLKGKFQPTVLTEGVHLSAVDAGAHDGSVISEYAWVVACDRTSLQPATVEQRVTAARFDQAASETGAATDRQSGGDHYKSLKIQPIEYIDANNLPYLEGNVVKYVTRHASKNGVQDIDKAIHYLELIKQMRYAEDNTSE